VLGAALLVAGVVLVVAGAELFFEGVLQAAARLRVAPFVLTAVVSGFELENLAAGVAANARGLEEAAAGTFLGGTTFLALGVAGFGSVVAPLRAELPRGVLVWTASSPLPLLALALDGTLSRPDGAVLLGWFALALGGIVRSGRALGSDEGPPRRKRFAVLRLLAGLAVLTGGGWLLGDGLERVVRRFGVSESLLGNTAVAAAVEGEEVARVAAPARRGRGDVALANVLGTIAHFAAFNAGVIALVSPLDVGGLTRSLHLPVAVGSVLVFCALAAWGNGLGRRAGGALLALYAAYVTAAVALSV
jgi:cation:H+ antiporter